MTETNDIGNELYPRGETAGQMATEHRDGEHPTDPPELALVAKCPLCYAIGDGTVDR